MGTFRLGRHFGSTRAPESAVERQPLSILKPVKGSEPGLRENLTTFFSLDYPSYELIFSLAEESDPARPIIEDLMREFPSIDARLILGDVKIGPNPKVNNLIRPYRQAKYDWILISDSNVRVERDYLRKKTAEFTPEVGIVTAVVVGVDDETFGAHLEAAFLNTFYARWMFIAAAFRQDCVVGKSMLFRKSTAERFGGMSQLGRFLAEDYMAGQAMKLLGLKVKIAPLPIRQPLPQYAFQDFWRRHLRWGRIRKAQAPLPVFFEPWISLIPSGSLGAFAFATVAAVDPVWFFVCHSLIWLACDLSVIKNLKKTLKPHLIFYCLAREVLSLPMWIHVWSGNSVNWRGQKMRVRTGGLLDLPTHG